MTPYIIIADTGEYGLNVWQQLDALTLILKINRLSSHSKNQRFLILSHKSLQRHSLLLHIFQQNLYLMQAAWKEEEGAQYINYLTMLGQSLCLTWEGISEL